MPKKKTISRIIQVLVILGFVGFFDNNLSYAYWHVNITAAIDGQSLLIFQGNTVQWHNLSGAVPGMGYGTNNPTGFDFYSESAEEPPVSVTWFEWYPTWPSGTSGDVWSDSFTVPFNLPTIDQTVTFLPTSNYFGEIRLLEQPSAANDYKLIVEFDHDGEEFAA
jgi:hypothetical protein